MKNVLNALSKIQMSLKAPKSQFNSFGKYNYRSCEDILEALKPLLQENHCVLTISDEVIMIGSRYYIKATAVLHECETEEEFSVSALAREDETKKGQDLSQVTGSTSSYARKYALNGLFCIDDTKDSDSTNTESKSTSKTSPKQTHRGQESKSEHQLSTKSAKDSQDPKQRAIRAIHAKASEIGMTHEELHDLAAEKFKVESLSDLSVVQGRQLYKHLQEIRA